MTERDPLALETLVKRAVETVVPAARYSRLDVTPYVEDDGTPLVRVDVHYPDATFDVTPDVRFAINSAVLHALAEVGDKRTIFVSHTHHVDEGIPQERFAPVRRRASAR